MESRSRTSPEQFTALLDFMESHGDISRPQQGAQGRIKSDRQWHALVELLNSCGGGGRKSVEKWKKVWADWKTKTKKKALALRREAHGTGGGPSSRQTLTALEQRILGIMGLSSVIGLTEIEERGFDDHTVSPPLHHTEDLPINIPTASADDENIFSAIIPILSTQSIEGITSTESVPCPPAVSSHSTALTPPTVTAPATTSTAMPIPAPAPATSSAITPPVISPIASFSQAAPQRRRRAVSPALMTSPTASTPRRRSLLRVRRRNQTPFERSTSEFVAVENRRLQLEEQRLRNEHQRKSEKLRLESRRIDLEENRNAILADVARSLTSILPLLLRSSSLPSTDVIPDES